MLLSELRYVEAVSTRFARKLALGVALALGFSPAARAYVCSKACVVNKPCPPTAITQSWQTRCIPVSVNTSTPLFGTPARQLIVDQSLKVWSQNPCTDLVLRYEGKTDKLEDFDPNAQPSTQRNAIAGVTRDADVDAIFDDPRLLAVTLTHFSVPTGEIFDADIMFNEARFRFGEVNDVRTCEQSQTDRVFDIKNTLVHELGHFIGLDHVTIAGATMEDAADVCEVTKRDLADDDRNGLCTIYPKGQPTRTCVAPADYTPAGAIDPEPYRAQCDRAAQDALTKAAPGGCSCGKSGSESSGLFVVPGLLLGTLLQRRAWRR